MLKNLTLSLFLVGGAMSAQTIPDRPEKLSYQPLTFEAPRTKDYVGKLRNGIPVYLAADPQGIPFVRINLLIQGGRYLEPKGKEGLASLTGNQWRAGGTTAMPAEKLDERLEFLAANLSSNLGDTSGSLSIQVMEKDLKEGLNLLLDVLLHPAFAQDRLDLAKKDAKQGIDTRNDSVTNIAGYQWPLLLNGEGHFSTAGMTKSSLGGITREDLLAFQKRLVHPANMVVAVSGKFEKKAMLEQLDRILGQLKAAPEAQVSSKVPAPAYTRKPGIYVVDKDVPQSMVRMAWPALRRTDPDWHAVVVMNDILGGSGFTSRLMKKLRSDEGLTYGVSSSFGQGPHWKGDFSVGLQTKNRSVAYALRLILENVDRMKKELVSDEELKVIKDGIVLAFPGNWANKQTVARMFANEHLTGWPADWWVDYREKIQSVTREDVLRVARKYLDSSQAVVLVVGNASEVENGDKDHPGLLKDVLNVPLQHLPLRDPLTLQPVR